MSAPPSESANGRQPPTHGLINEHVAALCSPLHIFSDLDRITMRIGDAASQARSANPLEAANLSRAAAEGARLSRNSSHLVATYFTDAAVSEEMAGSFRCVESRILSAIALEVYADQEDLEDGDHTTFLMYYRNVVRHWRRVERVCNDLPGFNATYPNSRLRAINRQVLFNSYLSFPKLAYPCAFRLARHLVSLGAWGQASDAFSRAYDAALLSSLPQDGVFYTKDEEKARIDAATAPIFFACLMQGACLAVHIANLTVLSRTDHRTVPDFRDHLNTISARLSCAKPSAPEGPERRLMELTRDDSLPKAIAAALSGDTEDALAALRNGEEFSHTLKACAAASEASWAAVLAGREEATAAAERARDGMGANTAPISFGDPEDGLDQKEDIPGSLAEVWTVISHACAVVLREDEPVPPFELSFDQDLTTKEPFYACHLWGMKPIKLGPPPTWPLTW